MDKNVKNALAAVGAFSLAAAAPMLVAGVAIGAVVANPDKAKKTFKDLAGRVEAGLNKYGVFDDLAEGECECCKGGACTCENECQCDCEGEPEQAGEVVESATEKPESEPTPNGGWIL